MSLFDREQALLLRVANTDFGRDLLMIPKDYRRIVRIQPHAITALLGVEGGKIHLLSRVHTAPKFARLMQHRQDTFDSYSRYFLDKGYVPYSPLTRSARSLVAVTDSTFSSAGDGDIYSLSADHTFASTRNGTNISASGTAATNSVGYFYYTTPDHEMQRMFLPFVTGSVVPSANTISSATLNLYVTAKTTGYVTDIGLIQTNQTFSGSLTTDDWTPASFTEYAARKALSGITTSSYLSWALTNTSIVAQGSNFTKIGILMERDIDNNPLSGSTQGANLSARMSEQTGTSQDPYLEVVHTAPVIRSNFLLLGVS